MGGWPFVWDISTMLPFTIPIVALLGAFAIGIVAMVLKSRENERVQRERMFLAEKGLEIPKELYNLQEKRDKRASDFRGSRAWLILLGIMCVFVGISVLIAISVQQGIRVGISGVIVILIGVGFLVSERLIVRLVVGRRQEP